MSLLEEHVRRFNEGVRTGDFTRMAAGFAEDAEMHFEGVPAGPFIGRDAIQAAYREQPPDDEVEILGAEDRDGVARYAWRRDGGRQAGRDAALSPQRAHSQARGHVRIALYDRSQKGETQMNLNGLLIGSENPQRLVEYYTKLFGKPNWDEGGYVGWQIGSGSVTIAAHDQVKGKNATPGRLIWNIETADVKGQFEKFKTAGATIVKEPYQMGEAPGQDVAIATFADPDNNYFQLMSPMEMPTEADRSLTGTGARQP